MKSLIRDNLMVKELQDKLLNELRDCTYERLALNLGKDWSNDCSQQSSWQKSVLSRQVVELTKYSTQMH